MILYRPVGFNELNLIAKLGYAAFPPRLPHQALFFPILTFEYARMIARDVYTRDANSGYAGFVTRFELEDDYAMQFPVHVVGSRDAHRELWVPVERLDAFNNHIVGQIEVLESYYGEEFSGERDPETDLPLFPD